MYKEIEQLKEFCLENEIEFKVMQMLDGCVLKFNNGSDVAQHKGTYGNLIGRVEFGYTGDKDIDFKASELDKAKEWILKNKEKLNKNENVDIG